MEDEKRPEDIGQTEVKKKSLIKTLGIPVILGVILGIMLIYFDADLAFMDEIGFYELPLMLIILYFGIFTAIIIHELGHLTFGKILGYRLHMFRAGIFSLHRENGKMRFSVVKNVGYGGLCAMIPGEHATLRQYAFYATGGIIFNIISGAFFFWLAGREMHPFISIPIFGTGLISVILGLVNAWPFYTMNQPTDGMMFKSIMTKSPMAERFYEGILLSKALSSGIRPRDLTLRPPKFPLDLHEISTVLYHYFAALDKGDLEEAGRYMQMIEENLEKLPPYVLPSYHYEIIYHALLTGDLEKAAIYREKAEKTLKNDRDVNGMRIKAAYAYYAENDGEKALGLAEEGLKVSGKYPYKGQGIFEADELRKLIAKIRKVY